jgi:dTDP-4-amino-4,6-dideoxygalactose transaminase
MKESIKTSGPMRKIPPLKVCFSREDRREILNRIDESLATGQVVMGKNVAELEREFAAYCGVKHAVAVSSGSSALEIVLRAMDCKGKDVLVPTNTFFATASAVLFAGGKPVLVDINPAAFTLDLKTIRRRRTKKTAAVMIVHIGGMISPEVEAIRSWCDSQGLWLIEDAAHAHGSEHAGKKAGRFGQAGCYSFFSTKVMTSGEGGMVVTDDEKFAETARLLRNHGKPQPWTSYHTQLGSNWRMTEFSAAVGLTQLRNLDKYIAWREKIAGFYTKALAGVPELIPVLPQGRSSWYKYIVLLDRKIDRAKLKAWLKEKGVGLAGEVYEIPLHRQPVFAGARLGPFPAADDVCRRHICLPLYYGMTKPEAAYVVENLIKGIRRKEVML